MAQAKSAGSETLSGVASTLVRLGTMVDPAISDTILARTDRASTDSGSTSTEPPAMSGARYELVGLLGEGGMGRVEQVRDRDLLREVAVKRLKPELLSNGRLLHQFLWEARVTSYLDHPNIVPVHDLGVTAENDLFFTMRLVRGASLEGELATLAKEPATSRWTLQHRLRVFLQVCNAIAFAHSRGVLHRDLKPANVMVGEYGEVIVTDWGIALPLPSAAGDRLRALMPPDVSIGESAGTPMYMSPEQAEGKPLDVRSDVYALGVMLYEMVALKPAIDGETVPRILKKVIAGEIAPLRSVDPSISSAIEAVVSKATARDPEKRYLSVRGFAADVEIVLDGGTPRAEAAPLSTKVARFYFGRDRGMAQMSVLDLDLWMIACHFFGAGLFMIFTIWVPVPWTWFWLLLLVGALVGIKPTMTWRKLRAEANKPR